jgi:hypothetical protein
LFLQSEEIFYRRHSFAHSCIDRWMFPRKTNQIFLKTDPIFLIIRLKLLGRIDENPSENKVRAKVGKKLFDNFALRTVFRLGSRV